ncbi:MAG: hypothetical protein KAU26_07180 [Methylococcales bacterium]|nr:hypothetical protein [Methylococcales bacterium]
MSYENFTIENIEKEFAITIQTQPNLFADITPVEPSERLVSLLEDLTPLASAIGTEKARSEFIIAPILAEIKKHFGNQVSLFSGTRFDVDKEKGLNGFCDFMFCLSSNQLSLSAPVIAVVEAKNDNINSGFGQCMAEMVAAQLYNQQQEKPLKVVYGCVTTGSIWRFIQLINNVIYVDSQEYYLDQLPKILGIFMADLQIQK